MRTYKNFLVATGLAMAVVTSSAPLHAQDLMSEALASLPAGMARVEYSSPAKLRDLPDYATLSQHYVGKRLMDLENSLAQLGVKQDDIDELVMGWRSSGSTLDLSGLARGRFDAQNIAAQATAQKIPATKISGSTAYCFGTGESSNCIAILDDSLGAFGSLGSLGALLKARAGEAPSAESDTSFSQHVEDARADAPIWGVAVGPAIPDWFKASLPNQGNVKLNWAETFQGVDALSYSVQPTDKVHLSVKMDCKSSQAAASLRQVMQGLKLVQQMAWQTQNPNLPNPFQSLDVNLDRRQVQLNLTTEYAELEAAGAMGKS